MTTQHMRTHSYDNPTASPRQQAIELTSFLQELAMQAPLGVVETYIDMNGIELMLGCEVTTFDVVFYDLCPDEDGHCAEVGLTEAISLITIELEMEAY